VTCFTAAFNSFPEKTENKAQNCLSSNIRSHKAAVVYIRALDRGALSSDLLPVLRCAVTVIFLCQLDLISG
jgi:citrate lyase beta subunit